MGWGRCLILFIVLAYVLARVITINNIPLAASTTRATVVRSMASRAVPLTLSYVVFCTVVNADLSMLDPTSLVILMPINSSTLTTTSVITIADKFVCPFLLHLDLPNRLSMLLV